MFLYWKVEQPEDTWKLIEDTPENRMKAISKGAHFFTWMSFSTPYKDNGSEPVRYGVFPLDFDYSLVPAAALDDLKKLLLQALPDEYGIKPRSFGTSYPAQKAFIQRSRQSIRRRGRGSLSPAHL